MTLTLIPHALCGKLQAISSKSAAHRFLIGAALSRSPVTLGINGFSADIEATCRCLCALGGKILQKENCLEVLPVPRELNSEAAVLDCGESGSTLRFLLPVVAGLGRKTIFTGRGRLSSRPLDALCAPLSAHGCKITFKDGFPCIEGRASGGEYTVPGDISSQFITGLLLMLPSVGGGRVTVTGKLASAPYVDLTLQILSRCGVRVEKNGSCFTVSGEYALSGNVKAEGDWSNSAFWLTAGALNGDVTVSGLDSASVQGDKAVATILAHSGAEVTETSEGLRVCSSSDLKPSVIDVEDIPDLVPVLAVFAAGARGETVFTNAGRLALKESNRLETTAAMINGLGGKAKYGSDFLSVSGSGRLSGGRVDSFNDHRITMAAAIASVICDSPVTVTGAEAADKSYPGFFKDFAALGGIVREECQ